MLNTLSKYIPKNSTQILAISGGPDSVFLLHKLLEFQKKTPFNLILAHLNHKLRGRESDQDQNFVRKLALKHKLKLEIETAQISANTPNLEAIARQIRYSWLNKIKQKYSADLILTAHHLNDNLETVLLNFTRGAGIHGLAGIQTLQNEILRPLLNTPKSEILAYLKKHKIAYCTDQTNQNPAFSRNRIRANIIPELKKINPQIEKTFLKNIAHIRQIEIWLEKEAANWLKKNFSNNIFETRKFLKQPPVLQNEILFQLYSKIHHTSEEFSSALAGRCIDLIKKNSSGKKTSFGKNHWLFCEYSRIKIAAAQTTSKPQKTWLKYEVITKLPLKKSALTIYLDRQKIKHPSEIKTRFWQAGDKIQLLGLHGTKKIQDIFTDLKIPPAQRRKILILINKQGTIIGIPEIGMVCEKFKVAKNCRSVLKIGISRPSPLSSPPFDFSQDKLQRRRGRE